MGGAAADRSGPFPRRAAAQHRLSAGICGRSERRSSRPAINPHGGDHARARRSPGSRRASTISPARWSIWRASATPSEGRGHIHEAGVPVPDAGAIRPPLPARTGRPGGLSRSIAGQGGAAGSALASIIRGRAAAASEFWVSYGRIYAGWRYSPLAQITAGNGGASGPRLGHSGARAGDNRNHAPGLWRRDVRDREFESRLGARPAHRAAALALRQDAAEGAGTVLRRSQSRIRGDRRPAVQSEHRGHAGGARSENRRGDVGDRRSPITRKDTAGRWRRWP